LDLQFGREKRKDTVKQVLQIGVVNMEFMKNFGPQQLTEWHELLELLSRVHFTEDEDSDMDSTETWKDYHFLFI
jgi:hypothetical protein